jgi:hypothetical protein
LGAFSPAFSKALQNSMIEVLQDRIRQTVRHIKRSDRFLLQKCIRMSFGTDISQQCILAAKTSSEYEDVIFRFAFVIAKKTTIVTDFV